MFSIGLAIAGVVVGARDGNVIGIYSNTCRPFTEQYARESTSPEVWHLPASRRISTTLTLVWALAFLATAVLGYIAVRPPATSDWTNWVVPIVLMTGAVKFTRGYPEHARAARG